MNWIDKKDVRARLQTLLPNLPQREDFESQILTFLHPLLAHKTKIISYVADLNLEIDLLPLVESCPLPRPTQLWEFRHSASWYFPKINESDELDFLRPLQWKKGKFGIWEPEGEEKITPESADLILVPALGFSVEGARLGRGKGYYDRALPSTELRKKTIGVTFSKFFPVPFFPEPHDCRVGKIITEVGVRNFLD